MAGDVPHEHIRRVGDRGWTVRLLAIAAAPDAEPEARDAAFESLRALQDHRSIAPLVAMLEDRTLDRALRLDAASVLDDIDDTTTAAQRIGWWDDGDDVLRAHALGCMGRFEADIVIPVAADDTHPLQAFAIEAMAFDFTEAEYMPVLIRGLAHEDEAVRYAAAKAVLWDEPIAAEEALLRAAADDDSDVAEAALLALEYYPTRRVLLALADLGHRGDEDVDDQATDALESVRDDFERVADAGHADQRTLARDWMASVADLVTWSDEPAEADGGDEPNSSWPVEASEAGLPVAAHEIQAMLADPDGEWVGRLQLLEQVDWAGHSADERAALQPELSGHPDPEIRERATRAFGAWGERDELVLGLLDVSDGVRRAATTQLGRLAPDSALAPILWARMLGSSDAASAEAVHAYARHADPAEAPVRLADLVREDPREPVRLAAIWALEKAGAAAELEALIPLLDEPPAVTWGVHIWLIGALAKLGIEVPGLERFGAVDHLEMFDAALRARCARTRS